VSFAAIALCVASEPVFIFVSVYFVIDSVWKLSDTPSSVCVCVYTHTHTYIYIIKLHFAISCRIFVDVGMEFAPVNFSDHYFHIKPRSNSFSFFDKCLHLIFLNEIFTSNFFVPWLSSSDFIFRM
jgi:hypothetical protein